MRTILLCLLVLLAGAVHAGRLDSYDAAVPADADELIFWDADGLAVKNVTMTNLAAYIGTETADDALTLTNKTIDADDNTLLDIANASIKAAAAIDVNKLAALTAERALETDASGFLKASDVTAAELQVLDGITATTAELNVMDESLSEAVFDGGANITIRAGAGDQIYIEDGAILPITDNDIDFGGVGAEFKNGYFDGTLYCDALDVYGSTTLDGGAFNQNGGAATFNQSSGDYDFCIESDNDTEIFYVDAGNDRVGISTTTPSCLFHVVGNSYVQGSLTVNNLNFGKDTGGDDTFACDLTPALAAYSDGLKVSFVNTATGNTGACTLNINSLGAIDIKNCDGNDPANDDIKAGIPAELIYYNGVFYLQNPVGGH